LDLKELAQTGPGTENPTLVARARQGWDTRLAIGEELKEGWANRYAASARLA